MSSDPKHSEFPKIDPSMVDPKTGADPFVAHVAGIGSVMHAVGRSPTFTGRITEPDMVSIQGVKLDKDMLAHPLLGQYVKAVEQAMYGKGERHGGAKTPFMEQPWVHYAKMHSDGFLTGQAAKKLEEAADRYRRGACSLKAYQDELRGALVYIGMALIRSDEAPVV